MRLYLDTSVFSAYYDERTPERLRMTRDFWHVLDRHEKLCSEWACLKILGRSFLVVPFCFSLPLEGGGLGRG